MPRRRRFFVLLLAVAALLPGSAQALDTPHAGVVSSDPADHTPHVIDGKVTTILPMGDRIYVGGSFTQVQGVGADKPVLTHRGLFAFDPRTGAVDPAFTADFDVDPATNRAVEKLAPGPDGQSLFVAGAFGTVNGVPQSPKLVKLHAASGARDTTFHVSVHSGVKDIVVRGDRLFLAGTFSTVNGKPRGGLAAVNTATGQLDDDVDIAFTNPRQGSIPRVETIAVTPDGRTLVAGGNFMTAGGLSRAQIAMIDVGARPARVADWQTDRYDGTCSETKFDTWMRDIDMAPDGRWFVVVTTGGFSRNLLCDAAARWETSARGSGLQPTWWNNSGGDSYTAVGITGAAVYVGGHFRWLNNNYPDGTYVDANPGPGGVPRSGIAALDPGNGMPLKWNPGRERGEGAWALVPTPDGLWVGSDTDRIGDEHHAKLAFLPLAGGYVPISGATAPLPGDLWTISAGGALAHRWYDGTSVGAATSAGAGWAGVRGAFTAGGKLYTGRDDGRLTVQPVGPSGPYGTATAVDLHGLTSTLFPVARLTGMFYDAGRLYHTVNGDSRLFYRWFSPDDDIVGNDVFVATTKADGFDFSDVTGLALASGRLTYSRGGVLHSVAFSGGRPVPATDAVVANSTGTDWTARGMFVLAATSAPPVGTAGPVGNPGVGTPGYWMAGGDGSVFAFGSAASLGSAGPVLNQPVVGMAATPSGGGYWLVATDGGIFSFGDARFHGSTGGIKLNQPIVGMAATPTGRGYWLVASDGGIFSFGDARFHGSTGGIKLNRPIVGMAATPTGRGYWLLASDGGIFAFGDAGFHGSTGGIRLNRPIVGMAPTGSGTGYWLVASDGGIFAFGDAGFHGSTGAMSLNQPIAGMVATGDGNGYWLVARDGGVFAFNAPFVGSAGGRSLRAPIVAFVSR